MRSMKKRKNLMALLLVASMSFSSIGVTPAPSVFASETEAATATDSAEVGSEGDAEEVINYPAQDFEETTNSGIKVKSASSEGIFPENTTMIVSDVSTEKTEELTSKVDGEVQDAIAVDIAFFNEAGEEIEPKDGKAVDVSIELSEEQELEGEDFELLHYDEENDEIEKIDDIVADSTGVDFSNGEFSIYVFTTNGYVEKDKLTGIVGESGGTNRTDNPYYLKVGQTVKLRTEDNTNGFSIPDAYSEYLQITSTETVDVNGVTMTEVVVEAKKPTSDLSDDVAIVMQNTTPYYIRVIDPETVTGSYDHSDIEISEGVKYTSKEATVYADGTVKTVERTYDMYVAHVDYSELYGIKKGETTETKLATYQEYMYELLNGSQHEYTSKYYALWNPQIGGFNPDVQWVDKSSKITRAVFYIDIGLAPVSEKTTIKKIDGTTTVTENSDFNKSGDSILQNQVMGCGEQMVIDANNVCPWHDGFDFSINGSVMDNVVATPEKVQLTAKKNLTGRSLTSGEFTFELYDDTGVIDTATCDASGNVVFDEIYYLDAQGSNVKNEGLIYSTPGEYTYHIREVLPEAQGTTVTEKDGVKYDDKIIDVTVTVTRKEVKTTVNGKEVTSYILEVATEYKDHDTGAALTGAEFDNVYTPVERNIEGIAWLDANEDGKIDAGETKLGNVTVELVDSDGKVVATTTTDNEGKYKFSDVAAGTYDIVIKKDLDTTEKKEDNKADGKTEADGTRYGKIARISLPTDDEIRADSSISVGTDGKKVYNLTDQNAGFVEDPKVIRNIEGVAWLDSNKDGKAEADEEKFSGKTVQLIDKDGKVVMEVTTGTDGSYKFEDVPAGKYDIVVKVDLDTTEKGIDSRADGSTDNDGLRYGFITSIELPTDEEIIKDSSITKENGTKTYTIANQNAGFIEDAKKEEPPKKEDTSEEETPKKEETTETPAEETTETSDKEETTEETSSEEKTTEETTSKETTNTETAKSKETTPSKTVESSGNNLTTTVGEKTDSNKNTDKPAATPSKTVHTGDDVPVAMIIICMILSVVGVGFVAVLKRRKRA